MVPAGYFAEASSGFTTCPTYAILIGVDPAQSIVVQRDPAAALVLGTCATCRVMFISLSIFCMDKELACQERQAQKRE